MEIYKKFSFDSAHYLPNLPEDHKCRRMHGHTFYVTVFVKGTVDPKVGWIKDFFELAYFRIFDKLCNPKKNTVIHMKTGLYRSPLSVKSI